MAAMHARISGNKIVEETNHHDEMQYELNDICPPVMSTITAKEYFWTDLFATRIIIVALHPDFGPIG